MSITEMTAGAVMNLSMEQIRAGYGLTKNPPPLPSYVELAQELIDNMTDADFASLIDHYYDVQP